jgi:hypothetical protein
VDVVPAEVPITVVIPTVYAPPRAWVAAKLLADQVSAVGGEIVVASGHDVAAPEPPPPVRVVHEPGADVFALRAAAVAVARGDVVAILEDHIEVGPDYCARILEAFARDESALAVVGTVTNGAPRVLDRASFLLTWGPFLAPMPELPRDRCPPPGAISFRRTALPDTVPHNGFLEYELPVRIRDEGRMTVAGEVEVCHNQSVGMQGFSLQYHAGRGYTGLEQDPRSSVRRRDQLREAARIPGILLRQTRTGLGRSGTRETFTCMAAVAAFAACNAFGQMVGVLRGPGESPRHLE